MVRWIFRIAAVLILTAAVGGLMAFFTSPDWKIAAIVAVALYVGGAFALKSVFKRLMAIPFSAKGKVLRGAEVDVHSVEAVPEPEPRYEEEDDDGEEHDREEGIAAFNSEDWDDFDEDGFAEGPKAYYRIDATITPQAGKGGAFSLWSPDELMLAPIDAPSGLKGLEESEESSGYLWDFDYWDEEAGGFVSSEEIDKWGGPLRMRMVMGVPADLRRAKFQYYFESFGEVDLPGSSFVKETGSASAAGAESKNDARSEEWEKTLAAQEKKHGADSPAMLPALRQAARGLREAELYFEAMLAYERELTILQTHAPNDARAVGAALNNLAGACRHQGLRLEAEAACLRSLEVKRAGLDENSPEVAASLRNLQLLRA